MTKIKKLIETLINDVNEDESIILSYFDKILQFNYKFILLLGIPYLSLFSYLNPITGVKPKRAFYIFNYIFQL